MIAIGIARLLVGVGDGTEGIALGIRLIDHILDRHVNRDSRWPSLQENDYAEFVDADTVSDATAPWESDGFILSDPGHALEFVGLGLSFTATARLSGAPTVDQLARFEEIEQVLPDIMHHVFEYGFLDPPGGICKLYDLRRRKVVNSDMPWWSLPETMRAALACLRVASDEESRSKALCAYARCHNAFVDKYIRTDRRLMAVQTINADGEAVDVIPATPDADPGYHTGLSLIDCLNNLDIESNKVTL